MVNFTDLSFIGSEIILTFLAFKIIIKILCPHLVVVVEAAYFVIEVVREEIMVRNKTMFGCFMPKTKN